MNKLLTLHRKPVMQGATSDETKDICAKITELERAFLAMKVGEPSAANMVRLMTSNPDHRLEGSFAHISQAVNALQMAKNIHYDNSWSKKGMLSMFFNLDRKYSRLEAQIDSEDFVEAESEAFIDTLGDLAAYSMKALAWYAIRNPAAYLRWLESVSKEVQAVAPHLMTAADIDQK